MKAENINLDALQAEVNRKQEEAHRAAGARDAALEQLHKEYGCKTIEQAKAKLIEFRKESENKAAQFEKAYTEYIENHGD